MLKVYPFAVILAVVWVMVILLAVWLMLPEPTTILPSVGNTADAADA
jgi:hypothetical protein